MFAQHQWRGVGRHTLGSKVELVLYPDHETRLTVESMARAVDENGIAGCHGASSAFAARMTDLLAFSARYFWTRRGFLAGGGEFGILSAIVHHQR